MSVTCHQCNESFDEYSELAVHIMSKKSHRKGRKWAAKLLSQVNRLDQKKEFEGREPLSEEDKENRRELREQSRLSGVRTMVNTVCPKCKNWHAESLEVEYVQSPFTWKTPQGTLMIMCIRCRR